MSDEVETMTFGESGWTTVVPKKHLDEYLPSKWVEPFYFIQAADSQFGLIDRYIKKLVKPCWDEEMRLSEELIEACNKLEPTPKFMVICGDLLDAYPTDHIRDDQYKDFKRIYSKLRSDIPLVCVCGNHDLGENPTMDSINRYKKEFGEDYFYFTVNGVLFIVINSQFYKNREFVGEYAERQDLWIECLLEKCKLFKYSIVFEHIPWFLEDANEEDDEYFNICKETRLIWLEKFKKAGVSKIMCGHYHRNAGGWYEDMELVVTSAIGAYFGDDKSGVRVVKVLENGIEHKYYEMKDIPSQVELY